MVATGKSSICCVGQLQMQPSMGKKYQSRNSVLKRFCSKNVPKGWVSSASAWRNAMPVQMRLKRRMSRNIRQKPGRSALAGCAKTVARLAPLHSNWPRPCGTWTENDISDLALGTPSSANSLISCG